MQYPPFVTGGSADAAGNLVLFFAARLGAPIRVSQVTAEMPDGAAALCNVRLNGALISPLVPTGDAASGEPPIWVQPGDQLTVEWTGAPPGAVGRAMFIYDIGTPA